MRCRFNIPAIRISHYRQHTWRLEPITLQLRSVVTRNTGTHGEVLRDSLQTDASHFQHPGKTWSIPGEVTCGSDIVINECRRTAVSNRNCGNIGTDTVMVN